jgi:hypothetical protein
VVTDPLIAHARKFAEWALMERLPQAQRESGYGSAKRLETLKARIAKIRAGNGDDLPEVRTAVLALEGAAKILTQGARSACVPDAFLPVAPRVNKE